MREFPDDDACLVWLWRNRYSDDGEHAECPKCGHWRAFKRYETAQRRQTWTCTGCGYHVQPTAGTIFEKSSTSLHLWFYAIHLMTSTRCGISAKQLERELGVTYKTAWRMLNLIRNELMADEDGEKLSGDVEVDETFHGGKPRAAVTRAGLGYKHATYKPSVFGMVERGGRVKVTILPNRGGPAVHHTIYEHVLPESIIFTDDWKGYDSQSLSRRYIRHYRIKHKERVYVDGPVHTQTVVGFFGLVKSGIRGTYHDVSAKWLQGYLNEYAWHYNRRHDVRSMFEQLLLRAAVRS